MVKNMKSLQASMILRNEEEMLPRALDSMKGIDSVMICDTGSSDSSFAIYEEYSKKMNLEWFKYSRFDTENHIKHFSHARNECKEKCTGDWLFILDGDEYIDFDIAKIKHMINSGWIGKYDIISLVVKSEQEETTQPRVFRNKESIWYHGAFHNRLSHWPEGREGIAEQFTFAAFYQSTFEVIAEYGPNHDKEPDRTLNIVTEALRANPGDTRALYYIAREWLTRKEPIKALYYLNLYAEIAPPTTELAEVYFILSTIYADLQIWSKASEAALKAVGVLPSFKQAWQMIYSLSHETFKPYWKVMVDKADNKSVMIVRK